MPVAIRLSALLFAAVICQAVHAQYKCAANGKTTYSDTPCATGGGYVGKMEDSIDHQARREAEQLRRKEARQKEALERRENAQFEANQRAISNQLSMEQAHARASEHRRQERCADLRRNIDRNQRGIARYQDFGWQRSLTQQENELKRHREDFDRECR